MINMIWAQGTNGELGLNGQLPWKLPADMKHFKELTTGTVVVMGRKTYESLKAPLVNRINVVLTRDTEYDPGHPDVIVYNSHIKLLNDARRCNMFVIGGKEIYNKFMPFADRLYVTYIHDVFEADTYAPSIPKHLRMITQEMFEADEKNKHPYSFVIYNK